MMLTVSIDIINSILFVFLRSAGAYESVVVIQTSTMRVNEAMAFRFGHPRLISNSLGASVMHRLGKCHKMVHQTWVLSSLYRFLRPNGPVTSIRKWDLQAQRV